VDGKLRPPLLLNYDPQSWLQNKIESSPEAAKKYSIPNSDQTTSMQLFGFSEEKNGLLRQALIDGGEKPWMLARHLTSLISSLRKCVSAISLLFPTRTVILATPRVSITS